MDLLRPRRTKRDSSAPAETGIMIVRARAARAARSRMASVLSVAIMVPPLFAQVGRPLDAITIECDFAPAPAPGEACSKPRPVIAQSALAVVVDGAECQRQLPGLLGIGQHLGLAGLELEGRRLADHHLLALVIGLEGLVDRQNADIHQTGFRNAALLIGAVARRLVGHQHINTIIGEDKVGIYPQFLVLSDFPR